MEILIHHDDLQRRVCEALVANGVIHEVALPIARTIAACERDGTLSHGLLRLPGYIEAVKRGWADGQIAPKLVTSSASMIVMDARNGFTHLALAQTRSDLARFATATGCAILLIRNAHHFAALWPDIEDFAADGLIAMSWVASRARVAGWNGAKPVFGTNASAFACPRARGSPIVWDQAAGVGLDSQDCRAEAVLEGASPLPFGGVKGAAIAFSVEILAAALTGSPFGFESPAQGTVPSKGGQFLMVIDPARASADVASRVEPLVGAMLEEDSSLLSGSRRYARRANSLAEGIPVDAKSLEMLERLTLAS